MSLLNLAWRVVAAAAMLVVSPAMGQGFHPFGETVDLDPDWQFFAPVDIDAMTELSPRKRANQGWFGAYDRTFLWTSRPDVESSANTGDFGWGNRYDVGFMSENNSGWLFSFRNMGGPNVYDRVLQERIDRQNANDTNDPANPVFPVDDRNDPQLGYRAYVLGDSLNVIGLTNFEFNKTWRRSPYRYGGILEPMVGFKYSTLNDTALNERYFRQLALIGTPGTSSTTTDVETLISETTNIKNRMFGGQLGARYFTHFNRWTVSGELRAFGMANFQARRYSQRTIVTEYTGLGGTVVTQDTSSGTSFVHDTNTEFVFGFEARAGSSLSGHQLLQCSCGNRRFEFRHGYLARCQPNHIAATGQRPRSGRTDGRVHLWFDAQSLTQNPPSTGLQPPNRTQSPANRRALFVDARVA